VTGIPGILENHALAKLRSGGYAYGSWVHQVRTPALMRWIASAGFDFVFLDAEHSDLSWETIGTMCDMARASGLVPIVRPYERNGQLANRIQDIGAMGLMFHDVTSRAQVDEMLRWMRYPPRGVRGSSSHGAAMDYVTAPGAEIKSFIDENTMLVIQIESGEGIDNLDAILGGGGVDVVEIGRGDLSTSLGVPLEARHPAVLDAIDRIAETCRRHGVAVGVNSPTLEDAADMIRRGVRCVSFSNERRILLESYRDAMAGLRGLASVTR
jgi:2-keto-3-deoxy-L-rhamnonate aldolase RhmA